METKAIKISRENYLWLLKVAAELQANHDKPVSFDDAINELKSEKMKKKKNIMEFAGIWNDMTDKEIIDYYKSLPMKKYDRLNFAYVKVHMLLDYIRVIEKHKNDLTSPANKVSSQSGKMSSASLIYGYIIMEICSFYEVIDKLMREGKSNSSCLPDMPDYRKTIMEFRNQVIAHLDRYGNLQNNADWMEQFIKVQKIGEDKIIFDFENYYNKCRILFGKDI